MIHGEKVVRRSGLAEVILGAGAQAEGMASRVGVHDEGAIAFLDRRAEDGRAQFDGSGRGWLQLIDGEIEMELLRRAVRPD